MKFIPWQQYQIKIKAADAFRPRDAAGYRSSRSWKKEPIRNVAAVWIAAQTRILSSELPAMSAAERSGSWAGVKIRILTIRALIHLSELATPYLVVLSTLL